MKNECGKLTFNDTTELSWSKFVFIFINMRQPDSSELHS